MPTPGQLALLFFSVLLFTAAEAASLLRLRSDSWTIRITAKSCLYWGVIGALAVLVWHSWQRGSWLPLEDNFDALVWLGILIAFFVLYVQKTKPIVGIDWFLIPVVVLLLIAAAVFGRHKPHQYLNATWSRVHLYTVLGGAAAFAVAGAVGAMYLITTARLRRKSTAPGPNFGSLERLEHFTRISVTLGFALLTIGLITGVVEVLHGDGMRLGNRWFFQPKVILAFSVWVVYALVLHAPINPSFRGRKAAMLSILGFVLMIGTLIVVQFMPAALASGGGK